MILGVMRKITIWIGVCVCVCVVQYSVLLLGIVAFQASALTTELYLPAPNF